MNHTFKTLCLTFLFISGLSCFAQKNWERHPISNKLRESIKERISISHSEVIQSLKKPQFQYIIDIKPLYVNKYRTLRKIVNYDNRKEFNKRKKSKSFSDLNASYVGYSLSDQYKFNKGVNYKNSRVTFDPIVLIRDYFATELSEHLEGDKFFFLKYNDLILYSTGFDNMSITNLIEQDTVKAFVETTGGNARSSWEMSQLAELIERKLFFDNLGKNKLKHLQFLPRLKAIKIYDSRSLQYEFLATINKNIEVKVVREAKDRIMAQEREEEEREERQLEAALKRMNEEKNSNNEALADFGYSSKMENLEHNFIFRNFLLGKEPIYKSSQDALNVIGMFMYSRMGCGYSDDKTEIIVSKCKTERVTRNYWSGAEISRGCTEYIKVKTGDFTDSRLYDAFTKTEEDLISATLKGVFDLLMKDQNNFTQSKTSPSLRADMNKFIQFHGCKSKVVDRFKENIIRFANGQDLISIVN